MTLTAPELAAGDRYVDGAPLALGVSAATGTDGWAAFNSAKLSGYAEPPLVEFCVVDVSLLPYIYEPDPVLDPCAQSANDPPSPSGAMHVAAIELDLRFRGPHASATAAVLVLREDNQPVSDATITGDWYLGGSLVASGASGVSGAEGVASIGSGNFRDVSGQAFEFCVTGLSHASLTHDPAGDVVTCGSVPVP